MDVVIVEGEGAVLGISVGHPIVTNGDFAAYSVPRGGRRGGTMHLFPNYLGISCSHCYLVGSCPSLADNNSMQVINVQH